MRWAASALSNTQPKETYYSVKRDLRWAASALSLSLSLFLCVLRERERADECAGQLKLPSETYESVTARGRERE